MHKALEDQAEYYDAETDPVSTASSGSTRSSAAGRTTSRGNASGTASVTPPAAFDPQEALKRVTKWKNAPDIFTAIADEHTRIGTRKTATDIRKEVFGVLSRAYTTLQSATSFTPEEEARFKPLFEVITKSIRYAKDDPKMQTLFDHEMFAAIKGSGNNFDTKTPEGKANAMLVLKLYGMYLDNLNRDGVPLDLRVVKDAYSPGPGQIVHPGLIATIFSYSRNNTSPIIINGFTDGAAPVLFDNPSLKSPGHVSEPIYIQLDYNTAAQTFSISVPKKVSAPAASSQSATPGPIVMKRAYMERNDGGGDCGPLSLVDQMDKLDIRLPNGKKPDTKGLRAAVAELATHFSKKATDLQKKAEQLDKAGQKLEDGMSRNELSGVLLIHRIREDEIARHSEGHDSAQKARIREKVEKKSYQALLKDYAENIKKTDTWVDHAFFEIAANILRLANTKKHPHLQIAIVRPDGRIHEAFPRDGAVDPEHTLFVYYNGIQGSGSHFESFGRTKAAERDGILYAIRDQKAQADAIDFFRSIQNDTDRNLIAKFTDFEETNPLAYNAIIDELCQQLHESDKGEVFEAVRANPKLLKNADEEFVEGVLARLVNIDRKAKAAASSTDSDAEADTASVTSTSAHRRGSAATSETESDTQSVKSERRKVTKKAAKKARIKRAKALEKVREALSRHLTPTGSAKSSKAGSGDTSASGSQSGTPSAHSSRGGSRSASGSATPSQAGSNHSSKSASATSSAHSSAHSSRSASRATSGTVTPKPKDDSDVESDDEDGTGSPPGAATPSNASSPARSGRASPSHADEDDGH